MINERVSPLVYRGVRLYPSPKPGGRPLLAGYRLPVLALLGRDRTTGESKGGSRIWPGK